VGSGTLGALGGVGTGTEGTVGTGTGRGGGLTVGTGTTVGTAVGTTEGTGGSCARAALAAHTARTTATMIPSVALSILSPCGLVPAGADFPNLPASLYAARDKGIRTL
jgi:hypothetical protein